jgi:hypothetical protein
VQLALPGELELEGCVFARWNRPRIVRGEPFPKLVPEGAFV